MKAQLETDLSPPIQPPIFLGVDVGGTNVKIGVVDDTGRPLGKTSIPTHADQPPAGTLAKAAASAVELLASLGLTLDDVVAVGLGTPGTMDIPAGMILDTPNMPGWCNYPVRERLAEAVGKPVWFANDANAAAFGECWVGRGRDFHSIVLLTLGTGVGGGIIVGDLSIDGENSCGSECGHIIIDYNETARLCGCGQRGHLEAYASATAVSKRAEEAVAAGGGGELARIVAQGRRLTPLMVAEAADAGDALAFELILETARYLGIGITSLMHTIDPGAVILAGAMNFGGDRTVVGRAFIQRIRAEVRSRAFPVLGERTVIDFAALGSDAGFIGAAGIARAGWRKQNRPSAG